jgi:hypothetical protein
MSVTVTGYIAYLRDDKRLKNERRGQGIMETLDVKWYHDSFSSSL